MKAIDLLCIALVDQQLTKHNVVIRIYNNLYANVARLSDFAYQPCMMIS